MEAEYEQLALFEARDVAGGRNDRLDPTWRRQALGAIGRLARNRGHFSVEDLQRVVGEPASPYQWGPVFQTAQRSGLIEAVDLCPSGSPPRHAGPVPVWRGRAPLRG